MSDDGDKTCPLCAEEMDLTDQQLKPCKCGYEICIWCWHHLMDMAERDNTEGRCPACRNSYNKEQIVGMAVNRERLMIESNTEKRYKTQKTKLKMSVDARKNLSRVRVVQRNLVYIMGLPSHLADESVLERKEYFGKYGKILKLSISRSTTTTHQASNCFSVYITYAREEDAVRCIQSVHNYALEGKTLRASFGTTKYCHSWLRNMICSNPDCLYLHDIGCLEDSFTKDEIISAYSRSRVQQVALNNLQRRAGNVLPPPEDDVGTNGTASSRTCLRISSNTTTNHAKSANVLSGRSIVLPATASWGSQAPNKCPLAVSTQCLQTPVKQKPDLFNSSTQIHSSVSSVKCISAWDDHLSVLSKAPDNKAMDDGSRTSEPLNHVSPVHDHPVVSDLSSETSVVAESSSMISAWDDDTITKAFEGGNIMHKDSQSSPLELLKVNLMGDEMTSRLCKSMEVVFDDACNYAWDDDVDATSNLITEPSFYHMDGKTDSLEALRCSDQDSQTSLSEDTTVGDNSCTSGISYASQFFDALTGDKDGLVAEEIVSEDSINVKSFECNDSLPKRFDCDDAINSSMAPSEVAESECLGISAVNFDSQVGVAHQNNDKYQTTSSNNCTILTDGNSVSNLCQSFLNREAEWQSSVSCSHESVATTSQSFPIGLSGSASYRQSDDTLAIGTDDNYSFANDGQREVSNVSFRSTLSSCNPNLPKVPCFPTSNSCKEDAYNLQFSTLANSLGADGVMDQGSSTLRNHSAVLPVLPKQDQQHDYVIQREAFQTFDMRRNENKHSYLVKSDDLATIKAENIDAGEGSIISNMLSLDFDPWDDSLQSADNFTKLLNGMDRKVGSFTLSSSMKSQNNKQSRFSFARQEDLANDSINYLLAASHVEKSTSSAQQLLKESSKDGHHNNILLNTICSPSVVLKKGSPYSSNNTTATLRPNIPAPPGFSSPNKIPPPGFSSQERYEQCYSSAAPDNMFRGSRLPRGAELHSPRNVSDVEFIDPAILAVGKGVLPLEANNSGFGLNSIIPSHFCPTDGNRIQPLMQHSIAAQNDRIFFNNYNNMADGLPIIHDARTSSRFPLQTNNTSYSPFVHHEVRASNFLNNRYSDWNNVLNESGIGMADIIKNEIFGNDNFIPRKEENKFRQSSSNYLYTRPYGM